MMYFYVTRVLTLQLNSVVEGAQNEHNTIKSNNKLSEKEEENTFF